MNSSNYAPDSIGQLAAPAVTVAFDAAGLPAKFTVASPATPSTPAPASSVDSDFVTHSASEHSVSYARSVDQTRYRSDRLSLPDVVHLQAAWQDLAPSLDRQDFILTVDRCYGNGRARLPSAADAALIFQTNQTNQISAQAASTTAQALASELNPQSGFPRDPRRDHGR